MLGQMNFNYKILNVKVASCCIKLPQCNKDIRVQFWTALFFSTSPFIHLPQFLGP